jgi:hypothetical protein
MRVCIAQFVALSATSTQAPERSIRNRKMDVHLNDKFARVANYSAMFAATAGWLPSGAFGSQLRTYMNSLYTKALLGLVALAVSMALLLFAPAETTPDVRKRIPISCWHTACTRLVLGTPRRPLYDVISGMAKRPPQPRAAASIR